MQGTENYDLFISYRHDGDDFEAVKNLKPQLEDLGLKVFMDDPGVTTFEGITPTIRESLSRSKAMLCYFTKNYLASRACIWELTAAYIAAQKQGGLAKDRIFILNPGDQRDLLKYLPPDLADVNCAFTGESALKHLPQRLQNIQGAFQDLGPLSPPDAFGRTITGSTRFAGRLKEMWEIHSHLHKGDFPLVNARHVGPNIAIISGMGGLGKSLLAEEYALRFGAAYPGGIYWLEAHGSYNTDQPDVEAFKAACSEQYLKLLRSSGLKPPQDASFDELRPMMAGVLADKKDRSLWIVDDIPYGLADHVVAVKAWFAPHPSASTLITTRSKEYGSIGREIPLDVLEETEALELLEQHGIDVTDQENQALELIERLGYHAMAVDIAGAAIKNSGSAIPDYLAMLDQDTGNLETSKKLIEQVLERRKAILGPNHPDVTASAWNLFNTLAQMEDYQAAQQVLNEDLMWLLDESIDLQDARQIQIRDTLKKAVRANESTPDETLSDDKRALKLMDRGDWAGARVLWEPLLENMVKTMPVNHPDRTYVAWHLFFCLDQLGEHDRAREILHEHLLWLAGADESQLGAFLKPMREEVIRITTRSQSQALAGETAPDIQQGMELMEAGDWAAARDVWSSVLGAMLDRLPARHPDTTVAAFYLFACLHNLQESDGAKDVLQLHLRWLADADEAGLDDRLKSIREQVIKLTS